jgi:hypothetical protein
MRAAPLALLPLLLATVATADVVVVTDPPQGHVNLAAGAPGAGELSGIAWVAGDQYYAVSDSGALLFELDVDVDPATGEILAASVVDSLALGAGSDLEGLVHPPLGGAVLASDEVGPAIREYRLSDGAVLASVAVPALYANLRANFGLEALALRVAPNPTDDALWTANEEALSVDGPLATNTAGSVVRLQRFDAALDPDGQWAYETDPYPGSPFGGNERSGVVELLALPGGELVVLERSFSSQLFQARLYQVDFAGATDTTALASLASDPYVPVGKTLLWSFPTAFSNYEGMALGPTLDDGARSLILVADDGGGASQTLYALALPEPGGALPRVAGALLVLRLGRRRRARQAVAACAARLLERDGSCFGSACR